MNTNAKEISEKFAGVGITIAPDEVQNRLEKLLKFKVPPEEAARTVIKNIALEKGVNLNALYYKTEISKIGDIKEIDKWVNLKARVIQLWENNNDKIAQVGLIGDETGVIKLIIWRKAGIDLILEEGQSYLFKNLVTDCFMEKFQVTAPSTCEIQKLDEEVQSSGKEVTLTGAIVDVQSGSGLIKRCPECNRALVKGMCGEHGKVEGISDIRIKAVLDDGKVAYNIVIPKEMTTQLTGITLDNAKTMATEAMDQGIVMERMAEKIIGRYFTFKCAPIGDNYLVNEAV